MAAQMMSASDGRLSLEAITTRGKLEAVSKSNYKKRTQQTDVVS
jgi:hypothetical protein